MGLHFRITANTVGDALRLAIIDMALQGELTEELLVALGALARDVDAYFMSYPDSRLNVSASLQGVHTHIFELYRAVGLSIGRSGTFVLAHDFLAFEDRFKWASPTMLAAPAMV